MTIAGRAGWLRLRIVLPLLIALGATIGISALRDFSDSRRTGQMLLVRVESVANRQRVEESSITGLGLAARERIDNVFEQQIDALARDIASLRDGARDDIGRLKGLGLGGEALGNVEFTFTGYEKVLETQLRLIADHEFDQAFRFDRERVGVAFGFLQSAITEATREFEKLAGQASLVADVGTFTVVLLAFLGLVLLSRRAEIQRRKLEQQLRHQAFHDSLTDLANRALFTDRVEHAIARSQRKREMLSVLFVDLDGFKNINDSLGHEAGDLLLCQVSGRLKDCVRDIDTVARFGGDEFAILLEDVAGQESAIAIAERVIESFDKAFDLDDRRVIVGASVGIASNDAGEDAEAILANADVAMYAAKARGKGCYELFRPGMRRALQERVELQAALEDALGLEQLVLHYQPIVDLLTRKIVGVEALVRWKHPERGLIQPESFIPMAEETGLILPLGRWVLHTGCLQARQWHIEHPQDPPLRISINLSPRQFQDERLVDEVEKALEQSGIPPESLVLEITETTLMRDTEGTAQRLRSLKDLGVQLAVDDFGTGYSSLSYLRRFPVDRLKIDRSFVAVMLDGPEDMALVQAVMKLAEGLGLSAVAEGIERPEQLEALKKIGCRTGQGYLFARPVPVPQMASILATEVDPISIQGVLTRSDEGTDEAR